LTQGNKRINCCELIGKTTLTEKSSIVHLAVASFACVAAPILLISYFVALDDMQKRHESRITALAGREFSLGSQKATVIGPYNGDVQVALKGDTGSKTVLLEYEAVRTLVNSGSSNAVSPDD
jgi:hypothetical protein